MTSALFDTALEAARAFHGSVPALAEFAPWPDDLRWAGRVANMVPGAELMQRDPGAANDLTRPLQDAFRALAPHIEWRLTYTEDEVGRDFLNRFGWFELAGPEGHFLSDQVRLTVGYWGRDLYYPWHQHGPEELYSVVSGGALFELHGGSPRALGPGDTRLHPPNSPHAMTTTDEPILTFVMWRGEGLDEPPRMSPS